MTHRKALITIAVAVALDVVFGLLYALGEHIGTGHALFCAVGNAVTEGACTTPATPAGHWIDAGEFVLVVPLFAAAFSLITTGLTAGHVRREGEKVRAHARDRHDEHSAELAELHLKVDRILQKGN